MSKKLNLTGQTFGRLFIVQEYGKSLQNKIVWLCRCSCGKTHLTTTLNLRAGQVQSCGCLQKERTSKAQKTHGKTRTTEYYSWINMKTRCYNPKSKDFKDYGGRGIKVCDRWLNSFENFLSDVGPKPKGKYSIDRINPNGNYKPSNCRWGTDEIQSRNKRSNHWIEYNGIRMILQDWAAYFGVHQANLYHSIKAKGIESVYQFYLNKHGKLPVPSFQEMYPYIDQKERKKIPDVLKQYIEVDL